MKNLNRIFLIVISVLVMQSFGSVAYADGCIVPNSGDPKELDFAAIPADGEETKTFALTGGCLWRPSGVEPETDPWITILEYKWTGGTGYVTYKVDDNLGATARDGRILVEGVVVHTVHQAANCVVTYLAAPGGADSVFVTNTACGRIIEFGSAAPPAWQLVYEELGSTFEGLVYGPDEQLYACDPTNNKIIAYHPATMVSTVITARDEFSQPAAPQCGWFTPDSSLVVTDTAGAGVYVFPNGNQPGDPIALGAPTLIPGSDGTSYEGVTMAANGDLLVIDSTNGSVKRFVYDPVGQSYSVLSTPIIGPGETNSLGIARASNGDIFVGYNDTLNRYESDGTPAGTCSDPFGGGFINFIKAGGAHPTDSYESLYVATVDGDVGTLWEIPFDYTGTVGTSWDCGSPPVPIATLSGIGSGVHPLRGVAVPFTGRAGKLMAVNPDPVPADSELFNFFDSLYEFRPEFVAGFTGTCDFEVTAKQVSPEWLQHLIDTYVGTGVPVVFHGDNGRGLIFNYGIAAGCTEDDVASIQHSINAYYATSSPTPVVCLGDENGASGCYATTFLSDSSFGFLPDDGRTSGRGNGDFSFTFLMDRVNIADGYLGNFCGFKSPLDDATIDSPLTVNGGSTVPIGFTVSETDDCKKGPFLKDITAVLSVTKLPPDPKFIDADDLVIVGGGSSEDGRIVFNQPASAKKGFELQFKTEYADGTPFEPGAVFELTVIDDSGMYFPVQRAYIMIAN